MQPLIRGLLILLTLAGALLLPAHGWAAPTFFWSAEGNSTTLSCTGSNPCSGTDYSASDTTATANGTAAVNGTAALKGSYGVQIAALGDRFAFNNASIISPTEGAVGFWINWQTFNTAGATIFFTRGANANDYIRIGGANTNELRLSIRNNGGSDQDLNTTAVNIGTGANYFITASWDATPRRKLCVYDATLTLVEACTTSTSAYTAPADLTNTSGLRWGEAAGYSTAFYLDNMFVGSSYDDADAFVCNANIATYTSYAACGGASVNFFRLRIQP